jgi:hypothetical protein
VVDARAAMALFLQRKDYLFCRAVTYDPLLQDQNASRSRRRHRACLENKNPNFFKATLPSKPECYVSEFERKFCEAFFEEVDSQKTYRLNTNTLKTLIRAEVKEVVA